MSIVFSHTNSVVHASVFLIPAFMKLITERFILGEEHKMERAFGSHYLAYKERVRRWL